MVERFAKHILEQSVSVRAVPKSLWAKRRPRFANQWPNNVKIYKSAKFDKNIPSSARVMSIFNDLPQHAN